MSQALPERRTLGVHSRRQVQKPNLFLELVHCTIATRMGSF